ncbi:MAG: radical SAM protein [Patescibacteria group bacterium]
MFVPKYLYIFLTENCNLNCRHCYGDFSKNKKVKNLNLPEWQKIFEQCASLRIFYYVISGGEPTTHPQFKELVEYLSKSNQYFALVTNGHFNKNIEDLLIKNKKHIIELKFSLDGYDFDTYNYLRQINNRLLFDNFIARIKRFSRAGVKISLGINIHSRNINHIKKFSKFINSLGPQHIEISTIANTGRAKLLPIKDKNISLKQIKKLQEQFTLYLDKKITTSFVDMPFNHSRFGFSCPAITDFMAISSRGILLPCPLFNSPDIKKYCHHLNAHNLGLKKVLSSPVLKKLYLAKLTPCLYRERGCHNAKNCQRCLAQSLMKGNPQTPPDFCLQYKKILFQKNAV